MAAAVNQVSHYLLIFKSGVRSEKKQNITKRVHVWQNHIYSKRLEAKAGWQNILRIFLSYFRFWYRALELASFFFWSCPSFSAHSASVGRIPEAKTTLRARFLSDCQLRPGSSFLAARSFHISFPFRNSQKPFLTMYFWIQLSSFHV